MSVGNEWYAYGRCGKRHEYSFHLWFPAIKLKSFGLFWCWVLLQDLWQRLSAAALRFRRHKIAQCCLLYRHEEGVKRSGSCFLHQPFCRVNGASLCVFFPQSWNFLYSSFDENVSFCYHSRSIAFPFLYHLIFCLAFVLASFLVFFKLESWYLKFFRLATFPLG